MCEEEKRWEGWNVGGSQGRVGAWEVPCGRLRIEGGLELRVESRLLASGWSGQPEGWPSIQNASHWKKLLNLCLETRKLEPTQLIMGPEERLHGKIKRIKVSSGELAKERELGAGGASVP